MGNLNVSLSILNSTCEMFLNSRKHCVATACLMTANTSQY